jgi:hypothetical protein
MRALPRTAAVATAVVAAVALVLLLRPTSGDQERVGVPADRSPVPSLSPPTDAGTDYRDPTTVCLRFAATVYRRDARVDPSAQAAHRRAMAYATSGLATDVAAQPDRSDPQWSTWQAHRVTTDPTATNEVHADEQPADGVVNAYRAARVTFTPVGEDDWRGPVETYLVYCTLALDPSGAWRVARYDLDELGTAAS